MPFNAVGQTILPPATRLREATLSPIVTRPEDRGFTRITTDRRRTPRDLDPSFHQRMIDMSFFLYRTNPLARRIINLLVDFTLGDGVTIQSREPALKDYMKEWWTNPYNAWDVKLYRRLRDLFIYGEWFHLPVLTKTGMMFVNMLQPDTIKHAVTSNASHEIVDHVILKSAMRDGQMQEDVPVGIIRPAFNPTTEELDGYIGEAFLFGINLTTDSNRGIGELFTLIDGIDVFEEMLFGRADKIAQSASMWWDLELEGFNQEQIDAYLANETNTLPPRAGTVWGHNEKAKLVPQFPNTNADDYAEDVRTQKSHIVSSAGFPGTWFDEPGDAGRAVGAEMAEPTFKTIVSHQAQIAGFLKTEMSYALWWAQTSGELNSDLTPNDFTVTFPRPNIRDLQRIGPAVARLAQAAETSVKMKFMTQEQAAAMMGTMINQLGLSDLPFSLDDMFEDESFARQVKNKVEDNPFGNNPFGQGPPNNGNEEDDNEDPNDDGEDD